MSQGDGIRDLFQGMLDRLNDSKNEKKGKNKDILPSEIIKKLIEYQANYKSLVRALRKKIKECEAHGKKISRQNRAYAKAINRLIEKAIKHEEVAKRAKRDASRYGIFVRPHPDGGFREIDVLINDELRKVNLLIPELTERDLKCGWEVLVDKRGDVVGVTGKYYFRGAAVTFKEKLNDEEALVSGEGGAVFQCFLSPELRVQELKEGDSLLNCSGLLVKALPQTEGKDKLIDIEEVTDVDWSQVGGLSKAVKKIKRSLLPFRRREAYAQLKGKNMPKGIILHGPEGCGKTLSAKVIAADIGRSRDLKVGFMHFAGADLSDKYVGETARKLRELFARAKEFSDQGWLVIVFIDEIDSLFRSRDTADKEPWMATDIGQFNKILEGIEPLGNILIIGATNRKDLIDKAILRPGRLGIDIKIPRPRSERDIREILKIYLTPDMPFASKYFLSDIYTYIDHFCSGKEERVVLEKDREKIRDHFFGCHCQKNTIYRSSGGCQL